MSIFYNQSGHGPLTIERMRPIRFSTIPVLFVFAFCSLTSDAQTSAAPSPAPNLAPISFLTVHDWQTLLPDQPDGKKREIHAQFTWTQNHQAIRISNEFIIDGKPSPYIDGLYAWDPKQKLISFWYVGAEGGLTQGTLKTDGGTLIHDFEEIQPDGKTAKYVARVTPNEQGWRNEIFSQSPNGLRPMVAVQYTVAR